VEGAIVPEGFFLESPSPRVQNFVKRFEELFGTSPGYLEAQACDAALMLFHLANHPQIRSRITLRAALSRVKDFPGLTGVTSFDETGDADKDIYLLRIERSKFVQVKP
jgi:ABC-type branched-subunit amino acid transport system substrate-binding protein